MLLVHTEINICPPPTHQAALRILKNKKTGAMFVGKMEKSSAKKWNVQFQAMLEKTRAEEKIATITDAVTVNVCFIYKHTADSKRIAKRMNLPFVPKRTRPDLDNLSKSVLDCIVAAGWLKDDNQIVELQLTKRHADEEGLTVDILRYPIQT
jgi:Holliday junction resolvase RusA-like endonuclease